MVLASRMLRSLDAVKTPALIFCPKVSCGQCQGHTFVQLTEILYRRPCSIRCRVSSEACSGNSSAGKKMRSVFISLRATVSRVPQIWSPFKVNSQVLVSISRTVDSTGPRSHELDRSTRCRTFKGMKPLLDISLRSVSSRPTQRVLHSLTLTCRRHWRQINTAEPS